MLRYFTAKMKNLTRWWLDMRSHGIAKVKGIIPLGIKNIHTKYNANTMHQKVVGPTLLSLELNH